MNQSPMQKKALEGYGRGAIETEVHVASPHRIIQMLMEGALSKIASAKGSIQRQDIQEKSRQITWAMNIIQGLRASLDAEKGGEIAVNLDALYDYMSRRLMEANRSDDLRILDEVHTLLTEVKTGWDNIPADLQTP